MKRIYYLLSCMGMLLISLFVLAIPCNAKAATVWDSKTLLQNTTVDGDLTINGTLDLNGFKLTVKGNVIANAEVLTGNSGYLAVTGNYTQTANRIQCENGKVDIGGDFCICGLDGEGNRVTGNSYISDNNSTIINVGKSLYYDTSDYSSLSGTYIVKGDFVDKSNRKWYGSLHLNGTKQQKLELSQFSTVNVDATNPNIKIGKYFGGTLLSDLSVTTDEPTVYTSGAINIEGFTLTIQANMVANQHVTIDKGGKLVVKGNYTQIYYGITIQNGNLDVAGNLNICALDNNENRIRATYCYIFPVNAVINVKKDFYFDSTTVMDVSYGTFNVKGDFIAKVQKNWNCTVNLCGEVNKNKKQSVSIANGKISTLSLKNCPTLYNIPAGCYDKLTYNHNWDSGKVTKEPTFKEEGIKTYTCTICGEKYTETIPMKTGMDRQLIENFVSRMYTKALNRAAEEGGKTYWSDELEKQNTDGANVAFGFIFSDEFKNNNLSNEEFVDVMYATFFDRAADNEGKSYWLGLLNSGKSREAVFAGYVNSQEFENLCTEAGIEKGLVMEDGTVVNAGIYQFVKRQYTCCLSRDGERGGMDYWATQIATHQISADDVARKFFYSDEFLNKGYNNEQYISVLYTTFMGRTADDAGLQYWEAQMANGMSRQEVLDSFVASTEFQGILSDYGLR